MPNDLGNFTIRTMKTLSLSAWLLLSVMASAQDSLTTNRPWFLSAHSIYDFPESYGFGIETSIPFHSTINGNVDNDFSKENFVKDDFISAEAGAYHQPFEYTAIIIQAGIGIRYIKSEKHFTELSFNQGVLRTVYDGKVYELTQDGNIKERILFGRTYFTTGFSYSLNWSLHNRKTNLWFIQLKPSVWAQYPYNSFLKIHFSFQPGIRYRLKNTGVSSRIKHKQ